MRDLDEMRFFRTDNLFFHTFEQVKFMSDGF